MLAAFSVLKYPLRSTRVSAKKGMPRKRRNMIDARMACKPGSVPGVAPLG
jgi:hypothetical protein